MKNRTRFLLALVGFLFTAGLVTLALGDFDWEAYFPSDETVMIGIEIYENDGVDPAECSGPRTIIHATRTAVIENQFAVDAYVSTDSTAASLGELVGMRLVTANDANHNGVVEAGEWQLAASASASAAGGWTKAGVSGVNVVSTLDVYGVEWDWRDPDGTEWSSGEYVGTHNLEYDRSPWGFPSHSSSQ